MKLVPQFRRAVLHLAPVILFGPGVAAAQGPAANGGDLERRVDSLFVQWDRPDSPGCAVGVYRDGRIVYSRGYGMADLERRVPITPRTVFDIGSTSKQFAAAVMVLLEQDGTLSLDDDIRRWVPELPDYGQPITIRHLLHHTSGLRDYIGLLVMSGSRIDDVTTPDDALAVIARQRELNFAPGAEHLYSNSGYFLLSIIAERASGRSLRDLARERIFTPLGMTATHYLGSYDDIVPDRALAFAPRPGGFRTDVSRWLQLGDGAVFTNVEDLLAWDNNFYEPRVGGPEMLQALQTTGTLANGSALEYALGLMIDEYRGQRIVSHGGAWGGYRADLLRFPERRFSVATLCNLATTEPGVLSRRVADVYLADVLAPVIARAPSPPSGTSENPPAVHVPESVLRELAGAYRVPTSGALRMVTFDGGVLRITAGQRFELRPRSAQLFDVVGAPVRVSVEFQPPVGSEPRRMRWLVEGQPPQLLDRVELVTPTSAELAAYAGRYRSDELDATYTLAVERDTLVVRRRGGAPQQFRPTLRDEFTAGSVTMRFTRDATGQLTGFTLAQGRIRNLRFERVE